MKHKHFALVLEASSPGMSPFEFYFTGDRASFHIVSRHPVDLKDPINSIFDPFDITAWLTILVTLLVLTLGFLLTASIYNKYIPVKVAPNLNYGWYFMKSIFAFTEPEDISEFRPKASFSSGKKTASATKFKSINKNTFCYL